MPRPEEGCNVRFHFFTKSKAKARASVSYSALTESILEALAECLDRGVIPISAAEHTTSEVESAESEVSALRRQISTLQSQSENLLGAIASGSVSPTLLSELDHRFTQLKAELADVQSRHDEATLALDRVKLSAEAVQERRTVEQMLYFVAGLKDPHSSIARRFYRSCVDELLFHFETDSARGRIVAWSGQVSFSSDHGLVCVPFSGRESQVYGFGSAPDWIVGRLISGNPLNIDMASRRFIDGPMLRLNHQETREGLGLAPNQSWMLYVGDSILLQGYLSLYSSHPERPPWDELAVTITREFGSSDALKSAIERTHDLLLTQSRPSWARRRSRRETMALIMAASGEEVPIDAFRSRLHEGRSSTGEDWARKGKTLNMPACRGCGGSKRARLMIEEPVGYVCLDCRQDSVGVTWPKRFDRFIAYTDLWEQAGFTLELPSTTQGSRPKRRWTRRTDRLAQLSTDQQEAILADYGAGVALRRIVEAHGLRDLHDLYYILEQHQVPRRRAEAAKRQLRKAR